MEWVEVTGKSIEEAKDRALDRLGVDERDAEFEVLEEPRVGFLGRVKGEARVRARVSPKTPRAKVDGRRRRREGEAKPRTRASKRVTDAADEVPAAPIATVVDAEPGPPGREGGASRSSGGRRRRRPAGGAPSAQGDEGTTPETGEEKVTPMAELPLDEQAKIVARFMDGLLDAFGLTGTTTWNVLDEETAEVQVDGTDLGLLVGPKGRTLQALSDVARSVVVRHADGTPGGRVHLDVARYRERRREALIRFTTQIAAQVTETGKPVALEPMGAADRKTVHDAVTDIEGVRSTSEGEEPSRRVVILPAS